MGLHWSRDCLCVARNEIDDLWQRSIAVWVIAVVTETRQATLPIRRQEPQRVPTLSAPRVGDLAALQHDMINRPAGKKVAGGEAGVPRADNDRGNALDGPAF